MMNFQNLTKIGNRFLLQWERRARAAEEGWRRWALFRLAAGLSLVMIAGITAGGSYYILSNFLGPYPAQAQESRKTVAPNLLMPADAGLNIPAASNGVVWRHDPFRPDRNVTPFNLTVEHHPNPNYKTNNTVYRMGTNTLSNGYLENPAIPVVSIEMESAWENGRTGKLLSEFHLTGRDLDGTLARPLTYSFEHGRMVDTLGVTLTGNFISISDPKGRPLYKLDAKDEKIYLAGGLNWTIHHGTNDSWFLSQAGPVRKGVVQILKVDTQNRIVVGGANSKGLLLDNRVFLRDLPVISPQIDGAPISFGDDGTRTRLVINSNGSDAVSFNDSRGGKWALRATSAFQVRDNETGHALLHLDIGAPDRTIVARQSGNVGIGTEAPESRLQIAGALTIEGSKPPGKPSEGKAVIYLDEESGELMARINHGGDDRLVFLTLRK